MRRLRGYITGFFTALLLSFAGQHTLAAPIPDGWDKALDQYESICQRCISLRNRSLQGEAIPVDTIKDLLTELATLRTTLQRGSGSMSEMQRSRFDQIRDYYFRSTADPLVTAGIQPEHVIHPAPLPTFADRLPSLSVQPPGSPIRRWHFGMVPVAGVPVRKNLSFKDLSVGLMLFAEDKKSHFGAYLKGVSTVIFRPVSGTCFRDGTLPDGGFFYASGNTGSSGYAVTGGILYRFHRNVGVWTGIGYATRAIYWESADGDWYRVKDASGCGICPEAGLLLNIGNYRCGNLAILAGGSFHLAKNATFDVGLGWRF